MLHWTVCNMVAVLSVWQLHWTVCNMVAVLSV